MASVMVEPGPTRSPWSQLASTFPAPAGRGDRVERDAPPRPISAADQRRRADQRRLQDGAWQRWLWAVGANAPLIALPVQLLHAITRHTITPMVWSSLLALPPLVAQMVLILETGLDLLPSMEDPLLLRQQLLAAASAHLASFGWLSLASLGLGILGHKLGQDRVLVATRRRLGHGGSDPAGIQPDRPDDPSG